MSLRLGVGHCCLLTFFVYEWQTVKEMGKMWP